MVNPQFEIFYIESLLTITTSALQSIERLQVILQNVKPENHQEIIDNAQNIINQAAALSRYFWSASKDKLHKSRSQFLRQKLQVVESCSLKNREVRNYIEHFDEKLDVFSSKPVAGTIVPMYVGPEIQNNTIFFFRAYFTDKAIFKILNLTYGLEQIANEMFDIHNKLVGAKENGGRFI